MSAEGNIGILILAAGSSSRLGQPKQLLSYQHKSLLKNTIDAAKKAADGLVVVILGGNYDAVCNSFDHNGLLVMHNSDWEEGMSSSIRNGLVTLEQKHPGLDGVILSVCDQPFITANVFKGLIREAGRSEKSIVASAYGQTLGVPVLFLKDHFSDLRGLEGRQGAKTLLQKFKEQVAAVPFEKGEIDIDTQEDYNDLLALEK